MGSFIIEDVVAYAIKKFQIHNYLIGTSVELHAILITKTKK